MLARCQKSSTHAPPPQAKDMALMATAPREWGAPWSCRGDPVSSAGIWSGQAVLLGPLRRGLLGRLARLLLGHKLGLHVLEPEQQLGKGVSWGEGVRDNGYRGVAQYTRTPHPSPYMQFSPKRSTNTPPGRQRQRCTKLRPWQFSPCRGKSQRQAARGGGACPPC